MSDLEHARLMLAVAKRDFKALTGMQDPNIFADEVFGFYAQQAVEKTIKAWLSLKGINYPKVHDLKELVAVLGEDEEKFLASFRPLLRFTEFAVQLRYEFLEPLFGMLNRPQIIKQVSDLIALVEEKLQ